MDELFRLLPDEYAVPIADRLCYDRLCEVRIINGMPVRVYYDGAYYFLCRTGITKQRADAFVADVRAADGIIMRACEHSLYTVTDTLKRGYISVSGGIRIGVCGSGVMNNGTLTAVKDFTSVNIRLPHEIKGCAATLLFKTLVDGCIRNTLIISPPGAGKTTMLRDLCRSVSDRGYNVLLCDEKYEIASVSGGVPTLDVGCRTDVISGVDKAKTLDIGIANMRPDVIMMDELFGSELDDVRRASTCGIAVVATVHAKNVDDLRRKHGWERAVAEGLFDVRAVLSAPPRRNIEMYDGDTP